MTAANTSMQPAPSPSPSFAPAWRLSLVVVIFVGIVAAMLWLTDARSHVLSAVRAFVAGEGLYSKGQKDAVYHLVRYAQTHADSDYRAFLDALAIPLGDAVARTELEKAQPDPQIVHQGFIAAHNHPDDIDNMAWLFRRFRRVRFINDAIAIWTEGDANIRQLRTVGDAIHAAIVAGDPDAERVAALLRQVDALNERLTVLEDDFSRTLGEGNRWLEQRAMQVTYGATGLMLLGGIALSWMVLRQVGRANQALRDSEERYRSLVAATTSVVWTTDARGAFVAPQPAWESYAGHTWSERAADAWLAAVHPDDAARVRTNWQHALADGTVFETEARVYHAASGQYRYCTAHAVPLLRADGRVREWIGTLADVDERRRAEQALQNANRQKDEFLAMLAHELRNPLTPIRNAVHVLRHLDPAAPQTEHARGMIDRQVAHMSRLVDELLDVSRIERGKISLRQDVLDFAQLVRVAAEDYRATFDAAGLTLTVVVPDAPVWVRGDATRLSQAIGNLLHNASKFTDRGGQVRVHLVVEANGHAVLGVRDTGVGMDTELLQRVFDTFSQGTQTLDRSRGGLGLGLALVKGLVELHGGRATAYSAGVGRGSEFSIRLPLTSAPATPQRAGSEPAPAPQTGCRVLIIEDNADVAESMRMLLQLGGHEVAVAGSGAAGLEAAQRLHPEVVLCDIGLPGGMDGFAVARALRSDPALRSTYLIALTGYGQQEDRRRVDAAGFDLHLIKPVDPAVLNRLLATGSGTAGSGTADSATTSGPRRRQLNS